MPTQDHHDWLTNALNVEVSLFPMQALPADAESGTGEEGAEDGMSLGGTDDTDMSMADGAPASPDQA